MKKINLVIIFLSAINFVFSQENTANIWYFADHAGVSFNTGIPLAITDGQTDIIEGCATLCDINGNLLFYTDGMNIWNRNHQVMPNGSGLMGNPSATQSAVITPLPQSDGYYIVFTVDARENSLQNGLRYSIININLDQGLGDITIDKNILLSAPVSEKVTTVIKSNQSDFWVIAHEWGNNNFLSYSVTNNGVNTIPVVSSIGAVHSGGNPSYFHSIGCIKSNMNGDRIAVANYRNSGFFELFDFNEATGILSNVSTSLSNFFRPYGVEFSPSGNYLYGSIDGEEYINGKVYQFDITQASPFNNPILVGSSTKHTPGLQLGPNGKIYVSIKNHGYLGVINNPDSNGVNCNFIHDAVYLEGKTAWRGLPNLFFYKDFEFFTGSEQDIDICFGDSLYLENAYQVVSDTYYDTVQTSLGWDSIINTHLTILPEIITPIISENQAILYSTIAYSYQWYMDGNLIIGAINQYYEPIESGLYQVNIKDEDNCSVFSNEYNYTHIGIDEIENHLKVYPNPFLREIQIEIDEPFELEMLDSKGQTQFLNQFNEGINAIDLTDLKSGIYIMKIRINGKLLVKKVTKL